MADRISQEVVEVLLDNTANTRISQIVIEVILCPATFSIACPVNNQATLGLPYNGQPFVSGGTPPYTFEIV